MPSAKDNHKEVFEDPWMPREISSRSLPPLGWFARNKKKEREKNMG
jgi:hypothetical protein